jgi:hypothetical protein
LVTFSEREGLSARRKGAEKVTNTPFMCLLARCARNDLHVKGHTNHFCVRNTDKYSKIPRVLFASLENDLI